METGEKRREKGGREGRKETGEETEVRKRTEGAIGDGRERGQNERYVTGEKRGGKRSEEQRETGEKGRSAGKTNGDRKEENGRETGRRGQMETEVGVWAVSGCPGVGLPVRGDGQSCLT